MARYHMYSPNPVWFDLAGVANTSNGKIQFYLINTTTPKDTYNAFSGGSANANPVPLDSSGRLNVDVWLDGDYSIVVYDEDDVVIDTFDMRPATDAAQSIPIPDPDEFVTGDGTQFLVVNLTNRLIPDGTGMIGKVPIIVDADGTVGLTDLPEAPPAPEVPLDNDSTFLKIGTFQQVWGTGTAPAAASAKTSSVNITFPEAFSATPYHASVTISNAGGSTPSGAICTVAVTSLTTTGMTVTVNIPDDDSNSAWKLANATPFTYSVIGPCVSPDA